MSLIKIDREKLNKFLENKDYDREWIDGFLDNALDKAESECEYLSALWQLIEYLGCVTDDICSYAEELNEFDEFDAFDSGRCGAEVFWVHDFGSLFIFGRGDMEDYESGGNWYDGNAMWVPDPVSPWFETEYIYIFGGVTSIGRNAFKYEEIKQVYMSRTVKSVREGAFMGVKTRCLTFENTIETVESGAIRERESDIETLIVSAEIKNIQPKAFSTGIKSPEIIRITGKMPEDLTQLALSGLFENPEGSTIYYPSSWDEGNIPFYVRLVDTIVKLPHHNFLIPIEYLIRALRQSLVAEEK